MARRSPEHPASQQDLFLDGQLREMNPWWSAQPTRQLPRTRRHLVKWVSRRLQLGLAPVVLVRGPRNVGKTIAQFQVIQDLLESGVHPHRILRVQWDEVRAFRKLPQPILDVKRWYERVLLGSTLNQEAAAGRPCYLFFDELQNLPNWDAQLKSLVDHATVKVVVTGSSALRLEMGRDSLAGRITTLDTGVLSLTEIAHFRGLALGQPALDDNGLDRVLDPDFWRALAARGLAGREARDEAFGCFSRVGGYPIAHERADIDWPSLADQLNESVIRRVIQHDLRVGERGRRRDAALLEELFRLACRYVGQCPSPTKLAQDVQRSLGANVGPQRVMQYLRFLDNTLLLRTVRPLEVRLKRSRGFSKLCLADHGLRASWLQELVPLEPGELAGRSDLGSLAGHLAESVVGTTLLSVQGLDLAHLPERKGEPEVDYVITVGDRRVPVEVKYQGQVDVERATRGLRAFLDRAEYRAPLGLLVTRGDGVAVDDPRVVAIPLSSLMLLR